MIGSKKRLMLGAVLGLLVVFAANAAVASIICDLRPADDLFDVSAALSADQGMTPPAEHSPSSPPDDRENPPTVDQLEALAPAGGSAGHPSTVSPSGAGASGATAILCQVFDLPQLALQTRLPRESSPFLPTGPPFELLRPPRMLA